ncbi:hypothetical protein AX14_006409, partial [Amanita brunnescens Koide BX004]
QGVAAIRTDVLDPELAFPKPASLPIILIADVLLQISLFIIVPSSNEYAKYLWRLLNVFRPDDRHSNRDRRLSSDSISAAVTDCLFTRRTTLTTFLVMGQGRVL